MATNSFRPTALRAGVPTQLAGSVLAPLPTTGNSATNQQTVYEWLDYSTQWKTNPPFTKGTSGTTMESLHTASGEAPPRILRGFIRRSEYSLNDDASMSRLYFMYNPETISRDYMNYLDQGALDPFNTVFQSGNLVAPPSMLNFTFEIFFDRQEEAMAVGNRGVMVDMDYFDLVVRNVKPGGTNTNNTLPDNGVMMVNPRDITVVFSPEITVQGRPLNASVTYERFTHKMVPTRMRINLQIRVVYFGPQREVTTFVPETVRALESIPFPLRGPTPYKFEYTALTFGASNESFGSDETAPESDPDVNTDTTGIPIAPQLSEVEVPAGEEAAYIKLNMEVMSHGYKRATARQHPFTDGEVTATRLQYNKNKRMLLWYFCDCSSFIWAMYAELGLSQSFGWEKWENPLPETSIETDGYPDVVAGIPGNCVSTELMYTKWAASNTRGRRLWGFPAVKNSGQYQLIIDNCTSGDILLRFNAPGYETNHVGIIWLIKDGIISVLHAGSSDKDIYFTELSSASTIGYNCAVRPYPHH